MRLNTLTRVRTHSYSRAHTQTHTHTSCDLRTLAENTGSIHFYERKLAMDERKVRCHRELGHRAVVWNTHHRRTLVRAMFGGGADANEVDAGEVVVRVRGLEVGGSSECMDAWFHVRIMMPLYYAHYVPYS